MTTCLSSQLGLRPMWLHMMITHHEGAIAMAGRVLTTTVAGYLRATEQITMQPEEAARSTQGIRSFHEQSPASRSDLWPVHRTFTAIRSRHRSPAAGGSDPARSRSPSVRLEDADTAIRRKLRMRGRWGGVVDL